MFFAPGSKIFLQQYLPEADLALASAASGVAALWPFAEICRQPLTTVVV
jgi:hypothetical protein